MPLPSGIQFLWYKFGEFGIGSTNDPQIDIFLCSCHLFAWYCIDRGKIILVSSLMIVYGYIYILIAITYYLRRTLSKSQILTLFMLCIICCDFPTHPPPPKKKMNKPAALLKLIEGGHLRYLLGYHCAPHGWVILTVQPCATPK